MTKIYAMLAAATAIALVAGTYIATQMRTAQACASVAVAGGAIGGPFSLVDHTGTLVSDSDVIDRPALIYFGFTYCPDVCHIDNARNVTAVDILAEEGHDVTPIFISVDPGRDTPEVMADYVGGMHPDMIGLTGSEDQVRSAMAAYRVVANRMDDDPEFYNISHSVFTYFVTPEDGFVTFFRRDTGPEEMARDVACYLT